jgi:hypothetical protein
MTEFLFTNFIMKQSTVSFTIVGNPPVQARPRISWKSKTKPIVFDATSKAKGCWKQLLRNFLQTNSLQSFPVFLSESGNNGIKIIISFYFKRAKNDYRELISLFIVIFIYRLPYNKLHLFLLQLKLR